jgi:hypothetical protein
LLFTNVHKKHLVLTRKSGERLAGGGGEALGDMTDLSVETTLLTTEAGRQLVVVTTLSEFIAVDTTMGDTRITGLQETVVVATAGMEEGCGVGVGGAGTVLVTPTAVVTKAALAVAATVVGSEVLATATRFKFPICFNRHQYSLHTEAHSFHI